MLSSNGAFCALTPSTVARRYRDISASWISESETFHTSKSASAKSLASVAAKTPEKGPAPSAKSSQSPAPAEVPVFTSFAKNALRPSAFVPQNTNQSSINSTTPDG